MMLRAVAVTCLGIFAAAAQANDTFPPEGYLDPIDQQIARTGEGRPGRPFPCGREKIDVVYFIPTDECVKMLPPQRWRGLWRNDFEGSQFCPEPAEACDFDSPGEQIWLTSGPKPRYDGKLYRVDFIGRRTMYKGSYGHVGAFDHEIIVDRMIIYGEYYPPQ